MKIQSASSSPGIATAPPSVGQDGDLSIFTPEMYLPKPRIATHARYREVRRGEPHIAKYIEQLNIVFQRGVCISPPFPKQEAVCQDDPTKVQGYYEEMHRFEFFWWDKVQPQELLKSEFNKRYISLILTSLLLLIIIDYYYYRHARLQNCTFDWDTYEMSQIMKPQR